MLEFDNTITKDTVKHEPKADAGKYAAKKKEKPVHVPVGMTVGDESPKKKKNKKKKRKSKDKEEDEEHIAPTDNTMEEESKPVAKKKAADKQEDVQENCDSEAVVAGLGLMFDQSGDLEDPRITCEDDSKDGGFGSNEKIDNDINTKKVCDVHTGEKDTKLSENDDVRKNAGGENSNGEPMPPGGSELDEADRKGRQYLFFILGHGK